MWIICTNAFGNEGEDWVGYEEELGLHGNMSVDPLFVDLEAGDYHLSPGSPCRAESTACGNLGALDSE